MHTHTIEKKTINYAGFIFLRARKL